MPSRSTLATDALDLRACTPPALSTRILLFDTSAHSAPWPLFLEDLENLAGHNPERIRHAFVDEAEFLCRRSIPTRIATRALDWLTMKVRSHRCKAWAYRAAATVLRYQRHPVSSSDLNRALAARAIRFRPDLVVILMGFHIAPEVLAAIRCQTGAVLVNYATDDPFNRRLGTPELIQSIPQYDLFASTKRAIKADLVGAGARDVRYFRFGYKPTVHYPEPPATASERERFDAEVAFVGEGDADRRPFFEALIEAIPHLRLALYGGLWNQDRRLRKYFRGSVRGRDYRMALGGARIVVNLVRRENRDDHVMRTFEAPACGAFVLHERTESHLEIFEEGREAAFFDSREELVDKVRYYLAHDRERERIRQAGHIRTVTEGHSYGHRLQEIIHTALS